MAVIASVDFSQGMSRRKWLGRAFHALCLLAVVLALGMLAVLLIYLVLQGWTRVNWDFLTSFPSRHPEQAGIHSALLGSIYLVIIAGIVAFVLGVGAAIYLGPPANARIAHDDP